ncbi:MAG: glucose-1-phosphate thymidylyltransferase RfbA [candidate division WOR-3 bacterium]
MKRTKGIVLAGGEGTRLFPTTSIYTKQLITIYDKPLIYYPLSTLILAGINEILIISKEKSIPLFKNLFQDGKNFGLKIEYAVQEKPKGIAESLIIGQNFIGKDDVMLILGDNIFYGDMGFLRKARVENEHATIFGYYVSDPERYGVIEFDDKKNIISIEEKPKKPKSNYAVCGLYIYDSNCSKYAKRLKPSNRGELEITDLNKIYLERKELKLEIMGRGIAWLDTGTPKSMLEASSFIGTIEQRQNLKIGCIEEVCLRMGFLSKKNFLKLVKRYPNSEYKDYLFKIFEEI